MSNVTDFSGHKYNYLTLTRFLRGSGAGRAAVWEAICQCQNTLEVNPHEVARGNVKSCGKCQYSRRHPVVRPAGKKLPTQSLKSKYGLAAKGALQKGIPWYLKAEEFIDLIGKSCMYCGHRPGKKGNRLDMLIPSVGFSATNCVPICKGCKGRKGKSTATEFISWLIRVNKYFITNLPDIENIT